MIILSCCFLRRFSLVLLLSLLCISSSWAPPEEGKENEKIVKAQPSSSRHIVLRACWPTCRDKWQRVRFADFNNKPNPASSSQPRVSAQVDGVLLAKPRSWSSLPIVLLRKLLLDGLIGAESYQNFSQVCKDWRALSTDRSLLTQVWMRQRNSLIKEYEHVTSRGHYGFDRFLEIKPDMQEYYGEDIAPWNYKDFLGRLYLNEHFRCHDMALEEEASEDEQIRNLGNQSIVALRRAVIAGNHAAGHMAITYAEHTVKDDSDKYKERYNYSLRLKRQMRAACLRVFDIGEDTWAIDYILIGQATKKLRWLDIETSRDRDLNDQRAIQGIRLAQIIRIFSLTNVRFTYPEDMFTATNECRILANGGCVWAINRMLTGIYSDIQYKHFKTSALPSNVDTPEENDKLADAGDVFARIIRIDGFWGRNNSGHWGYPKDRLKALVEADALAAEGNPWARHWLRNNITEICKVLASDQQPSIETSTSDRKDNAQP